jgi:hypothetical protein
MKVQVRAVNDNIFSVLVTPLFAADQDQSRKEFGTFETKQKASDFGQFLLDSQWRAIR